MPRKCLTCSHPQRHEIEMALLENNATYREIAERFSISFHSLVRHVKAGHTSPELQEEYHTERLIQRNELEEQVRDLQRLLYRFLRDAKNEKEVREITILAREIKGMIELLGRFLGRFPKEEPTQVNVQVNILQDPRWLKVQQCIVTALLPYPKAKASVVSALSQIAEVDDGNS